MGTYGSKFCPECKALAFKCRCGKSELPKAKPFVRQFVTRREQPQESPTPTEVSVPQTSAAIELGKVTLDQIPGEPPKDNKGGRMNVYLKARQEVYNYFIGKLNS
jgi:hypothetical protein